MDKTLGPNYFQKSFGPVQNELDTPNKIVCFYEMPCPSIGPK